MKASIKFRDEQKPLFRAKVPLSVIGFPFQSGIVAGESKELSLNLSTFFNSGPSLKLAYRPNDSLNPFSLVFKSGIGHFGSPISSSMTMSAEFNLIGNQNPSFLVHFKPQLGDFTLKKSQSSTFTKSLKSKVKGIASDEEKTADVGETPEMVNSSYFSETGIFPGKKFTVLPPESQASSVVKDIFSGMEVTARTALPLRNRAVVSFRWGVRLPTAAAEETTALMKSNFPLLVMNKIGIEHVVQEDKKDSGVAEPSFDMKRQLEDITTENGRIRKAMDDLRSDILEERGKISKHLGGKIDRHGIRDKNSSELKGKGFSGKETTRDVNEELEKV